MWFEPCWQSAVGWSVRILRLQTAAAKVPASEVAQMFTKLLWPITAIWHLPASILFWSIVRAAKKNVQM